MATAERNAVHAEPTGQPAVRRWRFTVEDYHRMGEAGLFHEDDRVELIEGDVVVMSPIGSRHVGTVARIDALLHPGLGPNAVILVQSPIRLGDQSEPQPDLAVLRPRPDFYTNSLPGPEEVFLVIEVMDTTAAYDRGVKLGLYARAGVAEVWLVDLNRELVECHRRPSGNGYAESRVVPRGGSLAPGAFPDVVLAVDTILG